MKILIIDSHKGSLKEPQNLHWLNAKLIKDYVTSLGHEVMLIWSYPTVNDNIIGGFDVIILNHSSQYSYVDKEWINKSPEAKLFYICNEYNLGEPMMLWKIVKGGRKYDVIANHDNKISKVVRKYVGDWHSFINLNCLIVGAAKPDNAEKSGCIYYGSFRKGRIESFNRYLNSGIIVSTHIKNREKFTNVGINSQFINRVDWGGDGLSKFKSSLYIEDEINHEEFNCLANRFYEALNYNVVPIFDHKCINTINKSKYQVPKELIVSSGAEAIELTDSIDKQYDALLADWRYWALKEQEETMHRIGEIILT